MKRSPLKRHTPLKARSPLKRKKPLPKRSTTNSRRREYIAYLSSPEWKALREKVLARDNYSCRRCGSGENLSVHHLHYKKFKREDGRELVTLCVFCHDIEDRARLLGTAREWELEVV